MTNRSSETRTDVWPSREDFSEGSVSQSGPPGQPRPDEASVVRHEEELRVTKDVGEVGSVRIRTHADEVPVEAKAVRGIEGADVERISASEHDSGEIETLPDGSVSIPVFEERLVVSKQRFVRERIVVRKSTRWERETVRDTVRRERVEVEELPPRPQTDDDS